MTILLTTLSKTIPWIAIAIWDAGSSMTTGPFDTQQECLAFTATWGDPTKATPFYRTPHSDGDPAFAGCIQEDIKYHRFMLDIMMQRGKEP